MIAIKKIEVTPLDYNEGKIIDSFNTTDDKTKNEPSLRVVKEYVDENAIKVLSGTTEPTSDLGEDGDIYLQYE